MKFDLSSMEGGNWLRLIWLKSRVPLASFNVDLKCQNSGKSEGQLWRRRLWKEVVKCYREMCFEDVDRLK
jgi:hypothetical protein